MLHVLHSSVLFDKVTENGTKKLGKARKSDAEGVFYKWFQS